MQLHLDEISRNVARAPTPCCCSIAPVASRASSTCPKTSRRSRAACLRPELNADGLSFGRKRIARLMRAAGIAGVSRRRNAPITTRQATDHHPRQRSRPPQLRGRAAKRAVGGRHHLPADVGRLSLPRGRSRRLVARDRRMGLLGRSEDPGRARRSRLAARSPIARQRRPIIRIVNGSGPVPRRPLLTAMDRLVGSGARQTRRGLTRTPIDQTCLSPDLSAARGRLAVGLCLADACDPRRA